ncbi:MAG: hypothetical protein KJ970_15045 [Candidatus Eisenbacteria bacterium]|uniref:BPL/LPL catalytic domain-containing protein n=1 Tax=Eiseniibacteriota bacterium TaxID=2212470 RepID=A0A948RZ16_UNCEI|nr:hypothetical protein [Candidatus Eisenbacteria bacterium]MBU1948344.1 hypothetical protein [Candidatus Eisenbacteria bacterium]MBU2692237.1 hypothetical protein [Candidatus Eisenbacteria bacterium]
MSDSLDIKPYTFDDDLIRAVLTDRSPHVKVYLPDEIAVVIGRGSKPGVELHVEHCIEDGVPVYQRYGGGCAVVLDPGNVIVSVVLPTEGISGNSGYFNKISSWLIARLADAGIPAVYQDGISDLVVGGKKVGGSCIQRKRNYLYYSTTLLVNPRFDLIERYLQHPPREPNHRMGREHREFLAALPWPPSENPALQLAGRLTQAALKETLAAL